jgi:protein-tyrosine phosphatase
MSIKILMVCLGNICRSPLAEGILASKLPKNKFKVDSAGTGSWHIGRQPDERSIAIAKKNKLDISGQKGRQFTATDFDTFDYIYVMDNYNYQDVVQLAKNQEMFQTLILVCPMDLNPFIICSMKPVTKLQKNSLKNILEFRHSQIFYSQILNYFI